MATLTREAVTSILGEVDDHLAAECIATEATPEELAEAKAWVNNDEAMINSGRRLATGRVGALVRVLMRADEDGPAVTSADEV